MHPEAHGEHGEPCQECGAPLAGDQRYCLNCGRRRAVPRVDYRHYMSTSEGGAPAEPEPQPAVGSAVEPTKAERDYAPLAAVGGIAVLGLMLLVGVLIGKGNNSTPAAPAPIVRVGEPSGTNATGGQGGKSETTSAKPEGKEEAGKVTTGAKSVEGGLTGTAARNSDATVQATTDDLESLNNATGEDYEDAVKKLPDKIATPGAPPPIDKTKAPGGGGSAETIK
jgi:hypothetical protein